MSLQLALDKSTHDLIPKAGGGFERVDAGRYTVQLVKCRLMTRLKEYKLDPTIGWINFDDFKKNYDPFDLEMRATAIITGTKGVKSVDSISLTRVQRKVTLTFEATTIYGTISLTIPWG